jgi:predicted kinase
MGSAVVLLAGLPASGKTTVAGRLHRHLGGVLIRSCDVYAALGIDLPAWVERTAGFTRDIAAYDAARDAAYVEMARRLREALDDGAPMVILDAVHGEREHRFTVQGICRERAALAVMVLCRCDDLQEIERRFAVRRGREREPECEASDLAVYRDIRRRWQDPGTDRPPWPTVVVDTARGRVATPPAEPALAARIAALLLPYARGGEPP